MSDEQVRLDLHVANHVLFVLVPVVIRLLLLVIHCQVRERWKHEGGKESVECNEARRKRVIAESESRAGFQYK
jgi:hypothetical protein